MSLKLLDIVEKHGLKMLAEELRVQLKSQVSKSRLGEPSTCQ
jgi:hypothetical protein